MARNLPWKTKKAPSIVKPAKKAKESAPSGVKRKKADTSSDDEDIGVSTPKSSKSRGSRVTVPPRSFSPAEETEVEFMDEGLENDDIYMMVEDEFLTVAKKFTKQVHQAALDEMEKAAKTKSRETIATISRPVSRTMPAETRRKLQGAAGAKKRGNGVQKLLSAVPGAAAEEEDPDAVPAWVGTSLHGLMESPKRTVPSLGRLGLNAKVSVRKDAQNANYRPSRQFVSKPESSETSKFQTRKSFISGKADEETASEDDEDDLDAMPKAPKAGLISQAPVSRPGAKQSIFPKTKPQLISTSGYGIQSSKEEAISTGRSIKPSTVGQSLEIDKPVLSKENSETSTSSGMPTDRASRLAQIKKRLADKKRREQEF